MRIFIIFVIIGIFLNSCSISNKHLIKNQLNDYNKRVIAHRGAWKSHQYPENSIASLKEAISQNYAGSEFDIRMTMDDSLIINHDPSYHNLEIEKNTFNYLNQFKLANGEQLPTLRSFLLFGKKNTTSTKLILEIKPSEISKERGIQIARKVVALVHLLKCENIVEYISFDYEVLKEIAKLDKNAITYYLSGNKSPLELKKDEIKGADYHYEAYNYHPNWINEAKKNKILLNVWTVNQPKEMEWLIANDFNYITTNEPELLIEMEKKSIIYQGWKLSFSDEFNYKGLPDAANWNYDIGGHGWGNNEAQFYTLADSNNVKVNNGTLKIIALNKQIEQNNYTSAKLTTYQRYSMQYGKVDCRAKLPAGKGTWPAIWMLPNSIKNNTEDWPLCGEIDIMEHVGKDPNTIHNSLHSFLYNHIKNTQITYFQKVDAVSDQFHNYGIEWTPDYIQFLIDEKVVFRSNKGENGRETKNEGWPFDKSYFLILNLAIGGNWGGTIDPSIFPSIFEIDYVRIYQKGIE